MLESKGKIQYWALVLGLCFIGLSRTVLGKGGVGDGGGNILRSTPIEVEKFMTEVVFVADKNQNPRYGFMAEMYFFIETLKLMQKSGQAFYVPKDVLKILQKLKLEPWTQYLRDRSPIAVGPDSGPVKFDLAPLGIQLEKNRPCIHNGKPKDGSYSENTGIICISIPRLTSYSPEKFPTIILPLVIHELVHQGGGSEVEAQSLQRFISQRLTSPSCKIEISPESNTGYVGSLEVNLPFNNRVLFTVVDWRLREQLVRKNGQDGLYIHSETIWSIDSYIAERDTLFPDGSIIAGGEVIRNNFLKVLWNEDHSGELEFEGFDGAQIPAVVRNKIIWPSPKKQQQNQPGSLYGGFIAEAMAPTNLFLSGQTFTAENSKVYLRFTGSCGF